MADDEKCVQVGSFVWKWHESVGWYDADEDDPTFGNEGVLLDEIVRLRAVLDTVEDLHDLTSVEDPRCASCGDWPCPTHLVVCDECREARRG